MVTLRNEKDLLGVKGIPADAYWGVHTARAAENFQISGTTISRYPYLIRGLTFVKEAAARANHELGLLDKQRLDAIVQACRDIRNGALHDQFIVDVIQGGAGTSTIGGGAAIGAIGGGASANSTGSAGVGAGGATSNVRNTGGGGSSAR